MHLHEFYFIILLCLMSKDITDQKESAIIPVVIVYWINPTCIMTASQLHGKLVELINDDKGRICVATNKSQYDVNIL